MKRSKRSNEEGVVMRIFLSEGDRYKGRALYEQILLKARELKLAGATVFIGKEGFGAQSHLHAASILRLSEDLPVVIEIVDTEGNSNKLLPFLDDAFPEGIVTVENVKIIKYRRTETP